MKAITNHDEMNRRCRCLRRWYFSRLTCRHRSIERRAVLAEIGGTRHHFYHLLNFRTYINDDYMRAINHAANRNCIPGLEVDIFAE